MSMYNLGLQAFKQGAAESALIFFKRAVAIDPDLCDAQYNIGVILLSQKRYTEAILHFQEVLRVKPNDIDAKHQVDLASVKVGHTEQPQKNSFQPTNNDYKTSTLGTQNPKVTDRDEAASRPFGDIERPLQMQSLNLREIANGLNAPAGIVSDTNGNLFVANYKSNSIDKVSPTGERTTFSKGGVLRGPIGLAMDIKGCLYVANYDGNNICRISPSGEQSIISNELQTPYYLIFDKEGNLFISCQNTNSIAKISAATLSASNQLASCRTIISDLPAPAGLAFDHSENLYVACFQDNSVVRVGKDGTKSIVSKGGNIRGPIGLAIDNDGGIFVANYSGGTLLRLDASGKCTAMASGLQSPYYICFDAKGNLYLTSQGNNTVCLLPNSQPGPAATSLASQPAASSAAISPPRRSDVPIRDKWALVIGISNFHNPQYNLKVAAKDAQDFYNYLVNEANFRKDHVLLLLNENATRENIMTAFGDQFLPAVSEPGDLVVVYVSTHGTPKNKDKGGRNYIVAYDTDASRLYATGVDMDELNKRIVEGVKTDRALIVMDTCYSGAGVPGARGLNLGDNFDANYIAQGCGHLVISSSSPNEKSWESLVSKNGVFTKYLLEALRENKTRDVKNAFADVQKKVSWEVKSVFGEKQTPQLGGNWEGQELILSLPAKDCRPVLNPYLLKLMQSSNSPSASKVPSATTIKAPMKK